MILGVGSGHTAKETPRRLLPWQPLWRRETIDSYLFNYRCYWKGLRNHTMRVTKGNTPSSRANMRMITLNLANELYFASPLLDTVPKPRMWAWAKPTRSPQRRRTSEFMAQSLQYYAIWNHPNKPDSYSRLFVFHYSSKPKIRLQTWTDIKTSILS